MIFTGKKFSEDYAICYTEACVGSRARWGVRKISLNIIKLYYGIKSRDGVIYDAGDTSEVFLRWGRRSFNRNELYCGIM